MESTVVPRRHDDNTACRLDRRALRRADLSPETPGSASVRLLVEGGRVAHEDMGWASYEPVSGVMPAPGRAGEGELRPELADVGRLLRRAVHGVVGAARACERS